MSPRRAVLLRQVLPRATTSPEATRQLGWELARLLQPGDVVALYGDLGAGKTHLVKGIGAAFGVAEDTVSSPTFTIVNEYDAGGLRLYHIDAYRLRSLDEFYELGYEDYLYSDGLCLIEWPEHIETLLPAHTLRLRLVHTGPSHRRIELLRTEGNK